MNSLSPSCKMGVACKLKASTISSHSMEVERMFSFLRDSQRTPNGSPPISCWRGKIEHAQNRLLSQRWEHRDSMSLESQFPKKKRLRLRHRRANAHRSKIATSTWILAVRHWNSGVRHMKETSGSTTTEKAKTGEERAPLSIRTGKSD